MSDIPSNTNTEQLDEQLTAYLDGELPAGEARQMEDMLAGDERARKRLNQLASSWDLLDQLPRSAVDENFTRTTVEMVALSTEEDIAKESAAAPSKRRNRVLAVAVIALLAAGVGFTAVSVATPSNNDSLLRDLPVVVNFEQYRPVGSIDLLRALNAANVLTSDAMPSFRFGPGWPRVDRNDPRNEPRGELRAEPDKPFVDVPESLDQRRDWIANKLSTEEKLELRRNFERFAALSPQQQASLRELNEKLAGDPEREQLTVTLRRYNAELRKLSPADRGATEDLPTEKKIAKLQQAKSKEDRFFFMRTRAAGWMEQYGRKHEAELLAKLPSAIRQELEPWKPRRPNDSERPRWGNRFYEGLAYEAWRDPKIELPAVTEDEWKKLIGLLPDNGTLKAQLSAAADGNARMQLMRNWVQAASFVRDVVSADLERARGMLPPEERKEFDELTDVQQKFKWLRQRMMKQLQAGERQRFGPGMQRGTREGFGPDDPRRKGPPALDGSPPSFEGGQFEPDNPRRNGQPRGEDSRRDRGGPDGLLLEFRPGEGFDDQFPPPPPDGKRRPERRPMRD